jgi:hypothetical protein
MSSSLIALSAGQLGLLGRGAPALAGSAPQGLLEALAQVPDPRDRRGIRYGLAPVLGVAVCATLAGARSYAAIAEWAADAPPRLRAGLGLGGAVPDLVTIWRVLTAVDPAALDAAVGAWVSGQLAARRPPGRRVVLAVDGKTLRGARTSADAAPHLMACLDHASGVVLAQIAVDGKTNEISMFSGLLDQVTGLDGVVITADALHAQRGHAAYLHGRGAHYLVTVKDNQPGLLRQLRSLPWKDVPPGRACEGRAHGRVEKRIVKAVTVTAGLLFPHAAQAIQVTRRTRRLSGRNGVPRPATRSPRCPQPRPRRPSSPNGSAATGRSRTSCTGSAMSPSAKTSPPRALEPGPTSWPPSGTWSSASCAWPVTRASPAPSGTPGATPRAHSACSRADGLPGRRSPSTPRYRGDLAMRRSWPGWCPLLCGWPRTNPRVTAPY